MGVNGKEHGETAIVDWGHIGIMEKKMETLGPFKGIYRLILGLYRDIGVILG